MPAADLPEAAEIRYAEEELSCLKLVDISAKETDYLDCDQHRVQLTQQVNDSPDWLPDGWILEVKAQKSGARIGRQIKCYYDPFTRSRFYSKKAVFRHLKAGKYCSLKTNQKRTVAEKFIKEALAPADHEKKITTNSIDNALDKYAPDGLPHGWIKEVKFRKTKSQIKKDLFYSDPVSGYIFRSLKDAFRYIETRDIHRCAIKPIKRSCIDTCVEQEVHPSSAAKRLDLCRTATKRCRFSDERPGIDVNMEMGMNRSPEISLLPHSDHASPTEKAYFACKSGNMEENKTITVIDQFNEVRFLEQTLELEEENDLVPAIKTEPSSTNNKLIDVQNEAHETSHQPSLMKRLDMDEECVSRMWNEKPHGAVNIAPAVLDYVKPLLPENKSLLALQVNLLEEKKMELRDEDESQTNNSRKGHRSYPKKNKATNAITKPVRASRRLAALRANSITISGTVEVLPEATLEYSDKWEEESAEVLDHGTGSTEKLEYQESSSIASKPPENLKMNKAAKASITPGRASKRLAALRVNSITLSGTVEVLPGAITEHSDHLKAKPAEVSEGDAGSIEKSGHQKDSPTTTLEPSENIECQKPENNLLTTIQFESPSANKEESEFASPFGDFWPDPCIEFAIKTLTGDIPFLDDTLSIHDYFPQQLDSDISPGLDGSLGSNKLENLSQNEHLSQFDAWNQHLFSTKDEASPSSLGNGVQSTKKVN